jgi:hypothetical protein
MENAANYTSQQNNNSGLPNITNTAPNKGCHQELVTEPYTIYENKCDYNQYGPVNCQNLPTTMQQTKTVTICN